MAIPFKTPFFIIGQIFVFSFRQSLSLLLSKAFFFRDSRKTHTHFSHCFAKEEFLCKLLKMIKRRDLFLTALSAAALCKGGRL
jgi:hypothetical protein